MLPGNCGGLFYAAITLLSCMGPGALVGSELRDPERVISLGPSISQTIAALGEVEKLVGRDSYSTEPEQLAAKPSVGGLADPNLEMVMSLRPDLVLGLEFLPVGTQKRLQDAGIQVERLNYSTLRDVLDSTRAVGEALGPQAERKADVLTRRWLRDLEAVREQIAARGSDKQPVSVLLNFGVEEIFSAGEGTYLDELITAAGGENIAAAAESPWPKLNPEAVLARDPDVLIFLLSPEERKQRRDKLTRLREDPYWGAFQAVRAGRVYWIEKDLLAIPGPQIPQALHALAGVLRPRVFPKFLEAALEGGEVKPVLLGKKE
jgi:iron complex transport system substrate-binding protein